MTYRQLCILQLSATKERFNLRRLSYEGQDDFPKGLYQLIYEYFDLYNRGLINFGSTLAATLVDVNPGAAMPQALGVDTSLLNLRVSTKSGQLQYEYG